MKNTFFFLVAFLLSFNSFSQYVVTRTDTIFGKVISGDYGKNGELSLDIEYNGVVSFFMFDSIISITENNTNTLIGPFQVKLMDLISETNLERSNLNNNNTVGEELIKYGRLNQNASGLEVVSVVVSVVGGVTLNPPIMIVGGVVYLISWIVRTSSYKHVIRAGKISDGYYKNSMKLIQIIQ